MSANIVTDLQIRIDCIPLDAKKDLPLLCDADVDLGVQQQGIIRLQLAVGQDANGDWARGLVGKYKVGRTVSADVRIGATTTRLINGPLTQSKLDFSPETHESKFEVTGMDALEWVKRSHNPQHYQGDLTTIVRQVLDRQKIALHLPVSSGGSPVPPQLLEAQTDSDLDFLKTLAVKYNSEIYVESDPNRDTGFFQRPDFSTAAHISPDLRVNVGSQTNVRGAQFYIDLSGPTRVETNNIGSNGKAVSAQPIFSDLRATPYLSLFESELLGDPKFAFVSKLNRESQTTFSELQTRCDSELEKSAWVVIGKGELDTAAYGGLLIPRRTVKVVGAGRLFDGKYMVWKVTHSFKREQHCQTFELRRKLGMMQKNGVQ
jgi:hypothetical protein